MNIEEKFRGWLLGLAVGDALGAPYEFQAPGQFIASQVMIGGGVHGNPPGCWTDDTSMALCLAESLIELDGFNAQNQLERYVRWWNEGHFSSTGKCFDIGGHTRKALTDFLETGITRRRENEREAGDGTIMRLAPVPLFYARDSAKAMWMASESSYVTHGAKEAADACAYLTALIIGALNGVSKETLLSSCYCPVEGYWDENPVEPKIRMIMEGSFKEKSPPEIRGGFYVVESLEAALWAFWHGKNFHDGALMAVNLGEDADTTGAVYGQLAGAFYGEKGIPGDWKSKTVQHEMILGLADQLFSKSQCDMSVMTHFISLDPKPRPGEEALFELYRNSEENGDGQKKKKNRSR